MAHHHNDSTAAAIQNERIIDVNNNNNIIYGTGAANVNGDNGDRDDDVKYNNIKQHTFQAEFQKFLQTQWPPQDMGTEIMAEAETEIETDNADAGIEKLHRSSRHNRFKCNACHAQMMNDVDEDGTPYIFRDINAIRIFTSSSPSSSSLSASSSSFSAAICGVGDSSSEKSSDSDRSDYSDLDIGNELRQRVENYSSDSDHDANDYNSLDTNAISRPRSASPVPAHFPHHIDIPEHGHQSNRIYCRNFADARSFGSRLAALRTSPIAHTVSAHRACADVNILQNGHTLNVEGAIAESHHGR